MEQYSQKNSRNKGTEKHGESNGVVVSKGLQSNTKGSDEHLRPSVEEKQFLLDKIRDIIKDGALIIMQEKLRTLLKECIGQMMDRKMSADLIVIALDLTTAQMTVERKILFLEKMKQILLTEPTEEEFHTEISRIYKELKQR